jgi:segregation and condensation protein B
MSEAEATPIDTQSAPVEPPVVNALSLAAQVEGLLYVAKEPVTLQAIASSLETGLREIEAAIEELTEQYQWRGIRLQRHGNKLQLVSAPEIAPRVQKFLGLEEINRLSAAALETLAIIAYKQPITKPQLEMVRGVNCDGVMNTLEARNLIVELGRADTVGHPMRYGVSFEFLQYFGLRGTHEMPPVENLATLPIETPATPEGSNVVETTLSETAAPETAAQTDAEAQLPDVPPADKPEASA